MTTMIRPAVCSARASYKSGRVTSRKQTWVIPGKRRSTALLAIVESTSAAILPGIVAGGGTASIISAGIAAAEAAFKAQATQVASTTVSTFVSTLVDHDGLLPSLNHRCWCTGHVLHHLERGAERPRLRTCHLQLERALIGVIGS